jgi:hypothetical protein
MTAPRLFVVAACLSACGAVLPACGAMPDAGELARLQSRLVHATPSLADENAVVLLTRAGFTSWCTGSVVASNLILTARHCLYDVGSEPDATFHCDEPGREVPVLSAWKASSFTVHQGRATPLSTEVSTGVDIHSGGELDLCQNDVALLEVSPPLSMRPLALRLDSPPAPGEAGTLVGWGSTEEDLQKNEFHRLTEGRQRRDVELEMVGPGEYVLPSGQTTGLDASVFVGSEGACIGDSGAPFLARSGAIIGLAHASQVTSRVFAVGSREAASECVGAVTFFQRLDLQGDWIREAFADAGAALWLENEAGPADFGGLCSAGLECLSGVCVSAGASSFCSVACDDSPCPDGSTCVGKLGERICSVGEVAGLGHGVGCGLASGTPPATHFLPLSLTGALALRRRQRPAVARSARPGRAHGCHD